MYVPYCVHNYKGVCLESLGQLISCLGAIETCLEGTSTTMEPANLVEKKARLHLEKLDAALIEDNDEIQCGLVGHEALDSMRMKAAS